MSSESGIDATDGSRAICRHCGEPIRIVERYDGPTWYHDDSEGSMYCHDVAEPVVPRFRIHSRPEMTELPPPSFVHSGTITNMRIANDIMAAVNERDLAYLRRRAKDAVSSYHFAARCAASELVGADIAGRWKLLAETWCAATNECAGATS